MLMFPKIAEPIVAKRQNIFRKLAGEPFRDLATVNMERVEHIVCSVGNRDLYNVYTMRK
jgi:hypothetical protein